jgi:serine/threonine protein kinase
MDNYIGILSNQYYLEKYLGGGITSKVYLGKTLNGTDAYALKLIDPRDGKWFRNEIKSLEEINHPNVIKLHGHGEGELVFNDGRSRFLAYLALEHLPNRELFDYVYYPYKKMGEAGFGEQLGRLIFIQILEGINECHKKGIIHSDLKTENVMVGANFEMKIADFGYAKKVEGEKGDGYIYTILGTEKYYPPELLRAEPYNGVCNDIFCLGGILFIVVLGAIPWEKYATEEDRYYRHIIKNDYEAYWASWGQLNVSEEFKSLVQTLIASDPVSRPSIYEIMQHPWIQQGYTDLNDKKTLSTLRECFIHRQKIVEEQRKRELMINQTKVAKGNQTNVNGKVTRSGKFKRSSSQKSLEDYVDNDNIYIAIFKAGEFTPELAMDYLYNYFDDDIYAVMDIKGKFEIQVEVIKKYKLRVENKYVEFENLKFSIEIKNMNDEKFVLDFTKHSGDKFEFLQIYRQLVDSLI